MCKRFLLGDDRVVVWVVDLCNFFICFLWILGTFYFGKSCHGCFVIVLFFAILYGLDVDLLWYLLLFLAYVWEPGKSNIFYNHQKHFCWSVNYMKRHELWLWRLLSAKEEKMTICVETNMISLVNKAMWKCLHWMIFLRVWRMAVLKVYCYRSCLAADWWSS